MSAGKERSVPPPAMELIAPAAKAAAMMRRSFVLWFIPG
jgi:hypothetical protein